MTMLYPASAGPAGFNPPEDPSTPRDVSYLAAIEYDGATKSFPQDALGRLRELHPVDQMMAIGGLFPKGSVKSAPHIGHTLKEIPFLDAPNIAADIRDRVELAEPIATVLGRGDAEILRIDHWVQSGKLAAAIYYFNLVTDPKRLHTKKATIG